MHVLRPALAALLLLAVASCTSHHDAAAGGPLADPPTTTIDITVSARSCTVPTTRFPAGPLIVSVGSDHATPGSEVELRDGNRVLGEEEAVQDGHTGGFSMSLTPGSLQLLCLAGGKTFEHGLTVVKAKPRHLDPQQAERQRLLAVAAASWHAWVQQQLDQLVTASRVFDDAVRAGNLTKAKALYGPARVYYERVEPVAESFGDLDPDIDARINDVLPGQVWTGFHRIEKAMYQDGTLRGMGPYATQLDVQVTQLDHLDQGIETAGTDLANGATSLLEEVAKTKITGEEERYSHLDLIDLAANVAGAEKAWTLLLPAVNVSSGSTATEVSARFADLDRVIASLRTGPSPTDFPLFTSVSAEQRDALSTAVDGVSEPLSDIAALIVV